MAHLTFSLIFPEGIFKFPDFSRYGKCLHHFPGFSLMVGTLDKAPFEICRTSWLRNFFFKPPPWGLEPMNTLIIIRLSSSVFQNLLFYDTMFHSVYKKSHRNQHHSHFSLILGITIANNRRNKGLDIYYQREGDGSKCRKIWKKNCRPPYSREHFSQIPTKDPIIFKDPPSILSFYVLSTGRQWGDLVVFRRPPYSRWYVKTETVRSMSHSA